MIGAYTLFGSMTLILAYGVLIPNTRRRSLLVVLALTAVPFVALAVTEDDGEVTGVRSGRRGRGEQLLHIVHLAGRGSEGGDPVYVLRRLCGRRLRATGRRGAGLRFRESGYGARNHGRQHDRERTKKSTRVDDVHPSLQADRLSVRRW